MDHKQYLNPPITSAKLSIVLSTPFNWAPAHLDAFYSQVKSTYDGMPKSEPAPKTGATGEPQSQDVTVFSTKDGSRIINLSSAGLDVAQNPPYEGWSDFRAQIIAAIQARIGVAGDSPVANVGLNYDNDLKLPGGEQLGDYLRVVPAAAQPLKFLSDPFVFVGRYEVEKIKHSVMVLTMTLGEEAKKNAFHLTFLTNMQDESVMLSQVESRLDDLKSAINQTFENLITDKARALFGGTKDAS